MSAKLKAAYDDLVTYLGKDAKGVEKAKRLKDAANELRKKLAAAEEKLEQMEAVKNAARERADAAEAEKLEAEQKRQQAEAAAASHYYHQQVAQKETEDWIGKNNRTRQQLRQLITGTRPVDTPRYEAVFDKLRERVPDCVAPLTRIYLYDSPVPVFNRFELADGFTDDDIWQLGASVAILSSVSTFLFIATPKHGLQYKNNSTERNWVASISGKTMAWLKRNEVLSAEEVAAAAVKDKRAMIVAVNEHISGR